MEYDDWQFDDSEATDLLWHEKDEPNWEHLCKTEDGFDIFFAYDEDEEMYQVKKLRKGKVDKQGWVDYGEMQEMVGNIIFDEYCERVFNVLKKTINDSGLRKRRRWSEFSDYIRHVLWLPFHVLQYGQNGAQYYLLVVKGMPTYFQDALKWCREMPEVEVLAKHGEILQEMKENGFFVE